MEEVVFLSGRMLKLGQIVGGWEWVGKEGNSPQEKPVSIH